MDEASERDERVRRVFERAVQRELEAIKLHEQAARHLEQIASQLEDARRGDTVELLRRDAESTAANARLRAQAARDRAAKARERLRQEGIEPEP
jgi:hypothetical protein